MLGKCSNDPLGQDAAKKAPYKGPCADSVEKHEPARDIDTAVVDSLKALDHQRPIREADSCEQQSAARIAAHAEYTCRSIAGR